jgi:hypothetical protein
MNKNEKNIISIMEEIELRKIKKVCKNKNCIASELSDIKDWKDSEMKNYNKRSLFDNKGIIINKNEDTGCIMNPKDFVLNPTITEKYLNSDILSRKKLMKFIKNKVIDNPLHKDTFELEGSYYNINTIGELLSYTDKNSKFRIIYNNEIKNETFPLIITEFNKNKKNIKKICVMTKISMD